MSAYPLMHSHINRIHRHTHTYTHIEDYVRTKEHLNTGVPLLAGKGVEHNSVNTSKPNQTNKNNNKGKSNQNSNCKIP